ncbi:MAG: RNA pyrophosphohydrolase [Rhodospirillaceae bacterium]|nr:RNA pyrophosphohydrolase [Rhodospirillaceae bacterium]
MPETPPIDSRPYRRGGGIALINKKGLVFVGQRLDSAEPAWQMPQGGIDKGEEPRAAALRELHEEIGTDKAEIVAETQGWLRYDLPPDIAATMWKGKYRGQEQKWYLMAFTGTDRDINIKTKHPEFSTWKWLPFHELPQVIVGFKREIYVKVVAAFQAKVDQLAKR